MIAQTDELAILYTFFEKIKKQLMKFDSGANRLVINYIVIGGSRLRK